MSETPTEDVNSSVDIDEPGLFQTLVTGFKSARQWLIDRNETIIFDKQMENLEKHYGNIDSIARRVLSLRSIASTWGYESYYSGQSADIYELRTILHVMQKIRQGDEYIMRPDVQDFLQKNNLQGAYPLRYNALVRYLLTEPDLDPINFRRSLHRLEANGWTMESAGEQSMRSEFDYEAADQMTEEFYQTLKKDPEVGYKDLIAKSFNKTEGDIGETELIRDWIKLALEYGYKYVNSTEIMIGGVKIDINVLLIYQNHGPERKGRIENEYNRILKAIRLRKKYEQEI